MIRVVVVEHGAGDLGVAPGRALRDAGLEVVHAGPQDRPEHVVSCVVQEDADVLVVALEAGEAGETSAGEACFLDELRTQLERAGAGDVLLVETRGAAGVADRVAAALDAQARDVRD
ncbi:hypothetical protein [Nocardioides sp.]|uniref:hypothetical protein n=1 Tax=Nocardioides sp. TaxID=35761 RepID=UPI00286B34F2|nr:hypothetical protein [Nocardioides sp.]